MRTRLSMARILGLGSCLLVACSWTAGAMAQVEAAPTPAEAVPGAAPARSEVAGFLYGKITTRRDTVYMGRLRWDQEASWGDYLNAVKEDLPAVDDAPSKRRGNREPLKIFGVTIGVRWGDDSDGRQLVVRYGDLVKIEPRRGKDALLTMKNGQVHDVSSAGPDIGGDVTVWDESLGSVKIDWDDIETIEFLHTPKGLQVDERRLFGAVESEEGTFRGFIQWDQDECLWSDKLDGETRDGDMSIEMGRIRSIAKRGRSASTVTLKDGRELVLDDSNDVDDDNRGIFVDDPRYGRVLVKWDAFDRVEFQDPRDSGPSYDDFEDSGFLEGTVMTEDGKRHRGRIAFDLDESEGWELLNGQQGDVEYNIPFFMVASVEPSGRDASRVTLRNGESLLLEDGVDVGEGNAGILIYPAGGGPIYVEWEDLKRIDFAG